MTWTIATVVVKGSRAYLKIKPEFYDLDYVMAADFMQDLVGEAEYAYHMAMVAWRADADATRFKLNAFPDGSERV